MAGYGEMEIKQYHVYLINLDPTVGHEIKKTRPCIVLSPDEMNDNIKTIIIAPMTTQSRKYPTRVSLIFQKQKGYIVLDQMRTIDRERIIKELGKINTHTVNAVKSVIKEMLVD